MADIDYNQFTDAMVRALQQAGNNTGFVSPENPSGQRTSGTSGGDPGSDLRNPTFQKQIKQQEAAAKGFAELNKELKLATTGKNRLGVHSVNLRKLSQAQSESMLEMNKQFKTSADALDFWGKRAGRSLLNLEKKAKKLRAELEKSTLTSEKREKAEKELLKVEMERTEQMDKHFGKGGKWWTKALGAIGAIGGATVKHLYDDMRTQFGSAGIAGFFENVGDAFLQAVDPGELSRLSKENRAAQLALSNNGQNVNAMFQQTAKNLGELIMRTKNATEASELYATSATSLVQAGIKPSEQAIMAQIKAGDRLAKISGLTALEFAKLNTRLAADTDMRFILQGMDKQERRTRRDTMTGLVAYNRTQGMLQEQAEAAAIALGKMAGDTPLERMKKSAKLAAAAGALGIEGGGEFRRIMMAGGPKNAQEGQAAQNFMDALSRARADSRGQGLGRELMVSRLFEGLDIENMVGKGSVYNTALGQGVADISAAAEGAVTMTKDTIAAEFGVSNELFQSSVVLFDQAVNTWKNFGVGTAVSALAGSLGGGALGGTIAGRMMQGKGLMSALNPFSGVGKGSGGIMRAGMSPALAGRGAMALAGTAGAAAGAGLAGYGVGTLAYESNFLGTKTGADTAVGNIMNWIDSARGFLGDEEAGERAEYWRKSQEEKLTEQVAGTQEQVTEQKSTNEMMRELIAVNRAQLEMSGGADAEKRLAAIDATSQNSYAPGQ